MGLLTDFGNWLSSWSGVGQGGGSQQPQQQKQFDPSSVPSPDQLINGNSSGYAAIDELNNRIKDSYIASGGTGYVGPSDFSGEAGMWFNGNEPARTDYVESNPIGNFIGNVKSMFTPASQVSQPSDGRYWDETSADYDPAKAFLGEGFNTVGDERKRDAAVQGAYMDYFGDTYNDNSNTFDTGYNLFSGEGDDLIDNGENDYMHRSSNFITLDEAKRQADYFGNDTLKKALDEMPEETGAISKSSLEQFGYVPYTKMGGGPFDLQWAGEKVSQGLTDLGEKSEELWNWVSDLRNENIDWNVRFNGVEISGKSMDEAIAASIAEGIGCEDEDGNWMPTNTQLDLNGAQMREDGMYVVPSIANWDELTSISERDGIPIEQLSQYFVYGPSYVIDAGKFDNGDYARNLDFKPAVVKGKDGNEYSVPSSAWDDVSKNHVVAEHLANLRNPGGTKENNLAAADRIFEEMGSGVDFGPGGILAPSYLTGEVLGSDYWAGTLANGALSSAAYFNPYSLAERAGLAGGMSAQGLDVQSQNVSDSGIRSYNPAKDNLSNISMAVAAPVLESSLGSVGGRGQGLFKGAEDYLMGKVAPNVKGNKLTDFLQDAVNEGLEEVVTDPAYEYQSQGKDWYADIDMDEAGNIASFDRYGRPEYKDTSAEDRFKNYIQAQPDNFILGSAIGGAMNAGGQGVNAATTYNPLSKQGRNNIRIGNESRKLANDYFKQYVGNDSGFTKRQVSSLVKEGIRSNIQSRDAWADMLRMAYMENPESYDDEYEDEETEE